MAGFRHEEIRKEITEMNIKQIINEVIYIGFILLFAMNFTSCNNTERFVVLGLVEFTFISTKIYCKAKEQNKKGERKYEGKKNDKRNN